MTFDAVERHLFLEGIFLRYGYDFRQYSEASLNRRLETLMRRTESPDLLAVLKKILHDKDFFDHVLPIMTVTTTECFRDPAFFRALREKVVPVLKTHPTPNIWIAGCSSGEELYSIAILLKEEGLLGRTRIYATDVNTDALKTARNGIYDQSVMQTFTRNYVEAGGRAHPSEYYTADFGYARFDPALRENVVFSQHNLATDEVFAEFQLILCRNVLIYFNQELQTRVFKLFSRSLDHRGFLGLGSKETLRFSAVRNSFENFDEGQKIYQKKRMTTVRGRPLTDSDETA